MNTGLPLYTADQTRQLDALARETGAISGYTLMSRAGAAAFSHLRERWPNAKNLHVVCGTGNNGGDGWIIARLARMAGLTVEVDLVGAEGRIHGDARQAMYDYLQAGGEFRQLSEATRCDPGGACLLVDALVGTGFRGPLRSEHEDAVRRINASGVPVMAIDCPSGLNPDTGAPLPIAVRAELTVTFIGRNQGLFTGDGPEYCGQVIYEELGVSPSVYTQVTTHNRLLNLEQLLREHLPRRPRNAHKGLFGHVLIVGGNEGMGGAAILAGEAALRTGAGLVSLATHPNTVAPALARRPELMARAITRTEQLIPLLNNASVVVVGPGLGTDAWSQALLGRVLDSKLPLVIDADGLNLVASLPAPLEHQGPLIMTPHPGEAGRLLSMPATAVNTDRFAAVTRLAQDWGAVQVLKGSGTVIASPESDGVYVCPDGNPGMASGGMGDVLAGVIGALVAQGLSPLAAAQLGVCLHARAADIAVKATGEEGLLASDLSDALAGAFHWN